MIFVPLSLQHELFCRYLHCEPNLLETENYIEEADLFYSAPAAFLNTQADLVHSKEDILSVVELTVAKDRIWIRSDFLVYEKKILTILCFFKFNQCKDRIHIRILLRGRIWTCVHNSQSISDFEICIVHLITIKNSFLTNFLPIVFRLRILSTLL